MPAIVHEMGWHHGYVTCTCGWAWNVSRHGFNMDTDQGKTLFEQHMTAIVPPEFWREVLELAIDTAWGFIESSSNPQLIGDEEWFDLEHEWDDNEANVLMLIGLDLAVTHEDHPHWVRRIAEL